MTEQSIHKCAWLINPVDSVERKCWLSKGLGCSVVLRGIQTVRCGCSFYKCIQASFLSINLGTNDSIFSNVGLIMHHGLLIGLLKQIWFSLKQD